MRTVSIRASINGFSTVSSKSSSAMKTLLYYCKCTVLYYMKTFQLNEKSLKDTKDFDEVFALL